MLCNRIMRGGALALLSLSVVASSASAANTVTNGDNDDAGTREGWARPKNAPLEPENMIAYWPCAAAAYRPGSPHHFSFELNKRRGWSRLAKEQMIPAIEELGFKRLAFHLPLGKNTHEDGHMGIDAPDDLAENGNEWVVEWCTRWFDWVHRKHPDVEIIVYLGSHDADSDEDLSEGEYWEHFDRMWRGVEPFLDRDYISIVFDNVVQFEEDHPFARVAQLAKFYKDRQGRFVGVEGSPQKARTWTRDYAVMLNESLWRKQRHARNIPQNLLQGEVISIIDGHSRALVDNEYGGDQVALAADIALSGRTPAVQVWVKTPNHPCSVWRGKTTTEMVEEIEEAQDNLDSTIANGG